MTTEEIEKYSKMFFKDCPPEWGEYLEREYRFGRVIQWTCGSGVWQDGPYLADVGGLLFSPESFRGSMYRPTDRWVEQRYEYRDGDIVSVGKTPSKYREYYDSHEKKQLEGRIKRLSQGLSTYHDGGFVFIRVSNPPDSFFNGKDSILSVPAEQCKPLSVYM